MSFEARLRTYVSSVDIFIYAPPAYGKTEYIRKSRFRHDVSVIDTDSFIDDPPPINSHLEVIISNVHCIIHTLKCSLSIFFLPSAAKFKECCLFRGLDYQDSWYIDACTSALKADIIITAECKVLDYDRFIYECINSIYDGEQLPLLPSKVTEFDYQRILTEYNDITARNKSLLIVNSATENEFIEQFECSKLIEDLTYIVDEFQPSYQNIQPLAKCYATCSIEDKLICDVYKPEPSAMLEQTSTIKQSKSQQRRFAIVRNARPWRFLHRIAILATHHIGNQPQNSRLNQNVTGNYRAEFNFQFNTVTLFFTTYDSDINYVSTNNFSVYCSNRLLYSWLRGSQNSAIT